MNDPRITRLAETLLDHSCRIAAGENVLIEAIDLPEPTLVCRLVEMAAERGAHPFVTWKNNEILRSLYRTGTETNLGAAGEMERLACNECMRTSASRVVELKPIRRRSSRAHGSLSEAVVAAGAQ